MRKIILNLAISLDGYICDQEGGFDWILGHGDKKQDYKPYDFDDFLASVDTLVMGSVAYKDVVLSDLTTFADKRVIVASHQDLEARDHVDFIKGDIVDQVVQLKKEQGGHIWLFGGAGLTDAFIRANVVDEYVIAIIPTILGQGRPLFKGDYEKIDLHLDRHQVSDGIVLMTYSRRQV